jgi:NAD(P)-dependent dehydrogenase (short-subunit alcohol dehydrogenase family)
MEEIMLSGLTMVITGGGSGMGESVAHLASAYGAKVMVSDISEESAAKVAQDVRDGGGEATHNRCDVSNPDDIEALMDQTAKVFGGIDVLLNNAGIADTSIAPVGGIDELPIEAWDRVININLRGPWLCTRFALQYLKKSASASVINVASVGAFAAFPNVVAYGASKGGVAQLTRNLALELSPFGIRVNAYAPATIETAMALEFFEGSEDGRRTRAVMEATHLVPRLGKPEEVAEVACFLASPKSSFVNGAVWLVDGGQLAWRGQRATD